MGHSSLGEWYCFPACKLHRNVRTDSFGGQFKDSVNDDVQIEEPWFKQTTLTFKIPGSEIAILFQSIGIFTDQLRSYHIRTNSVVEITIWTFIKTVCIWPESSFKMLVQWDSMPRTDDERGVWWEGENGERKPLRFNSLPHHSLRPRLFLLVLSRARLGTRQLLKRLASLEIV